MAAVEGVAKSAPQRRAQGRMFDGLEAVYVAAYRPITGRITRLSPNPAVSEPSRPRSKGVFIVGSNFSNPGREEEFEDWYTNSVVPDVVALPGFVAGARYQIIGEPRQNEGQYFVHYVLEADDMRAAADNLWKTIAEWRAQGHGFEGLQLVYTAVYEAITGRITA